MHGYNIYDLSEHAAHGASAYGKELAESWNSEGDFLRNPPASWSELQPARKAKAAKHVRAVEHKLQRRKQQVDELEELSKPVRPAPDVPVTAVGADDKDFTVEGMDDLQEEVVPGQLECASV